MRVPASVSHPTGDAPATRSGVKAHPAASSAAQVTADLVALTKPRIVVMVLVTTLVGYQAGLASPPDWPRLLHLLLGMALAAGGTLALNQYLERHVDALMERTRCRPLPAGRLEPGTALVFGGAVTVLGIADLGLSLGPAPAEVTAATSLLYLFVYTPLKRRTPLCTLVGAVSGALPPLTGWVEAGAGIGVGAWALVAIMLLWQLPHTLAIGQLYRDDFARAGICTLPVVDGEGKWTGRCMALSSLLLVVVSVVPALVGLAGGTYLTGAALAGATLVSVGIQQAITPTAPGARRVLRATLLYLPILLGLLAYDRP